MKFWISKSRQDGGFGRLLRLRGQMKREEDGFGINASVFRVSRNGAAFQSALVETNIWSRRGLPSTSKRRAIVPAINGTTGLFDSWPSWDWDGSSTSGELVQTPAESASSTSDAGFSSGASTTQAPHAGAIEDTGRPSRLPQRGRRPPFRPSASWMRRNSLFRRTRWARLAFRRSTVNSWQPSGSNVIPRFWEQVD